MFLISLLSLSLAAQANSQVSCTLCSTVIKFVEELLVDTKAEDEIIALTSSLCTKIPGTFSIICSEFVTTYVRSIVQYLEQGLESGMICDKLGFCEYSNAAAPVGFKPSAFTCTICNSIYTTVQNSLKETSDVKLITQKTSGICNALGEKGSIQCLSVVGVFIPQLIQDIKSGVSQSASCIKIGFCEKLPTPRQVKANKVNLASPALCDLCDILVSSVMKFLVSSSSQALIVAELTKLTGLLEAPYDVLGGTLIQLYLPTLIALAESGLSKIQICNKVGFCSNANSFVSDSFKCILCNTVVHYIEEGITDPATINLELYLINKLCNFLPADFAPTCEIIAKEFVPYISQLLEQGIEYYDICAKINFCPSKNGFDFPGYSTYPIHKINGVADRRGAFGSHPRTPSPNSLISYIPCDTCHNLINRISELIEAAQPVTSVAITLMASSLPPPYSFVCETLAQNYLPFIVESLSLGLTKSTICQKIGLCPSKNNKNAAPVSNNALSCMICNLVVTAITGIASSTSIEAEISNFIAKQCDASWIPADYHALCSMLVGQYIPMVINLLGQGVEKFDICRKISLCPA